MKIEEVIKLLNEEFPGGFFLCTAPPEKDSALFAMYKYNPKQIPVLEFLEALIKRASNWTGGGSVN
jgi:hypothetical protein